MAKRKKQERDADGWLLEFDLGKVGAGKYWRETQYNRNPCCLVAWAMHASGRWFPFDERAELDASLDAVGVGGDGTVESRSDATTPSQRLAALEYWLVTYAGYEIVEVDA
jgi:hypothetical protein